MRKVLVANRGEIAVRILRACRDLELPAVAVYADADRTARHVRMAAQAVALGDGPPAATYLRIDRIVEAALLADADAVHPGYGFLSENAGLAAACRDAGLTFIGPSPEAMALVGDKSAARRLARSAGVPIVPGLDEPLDPSVDDATAAARAAAVGFPLLIKAVAGGGGRGMRIVTGPGELSAALRAARSEAATAFGDASVYFERLITQARHVEVQVLADHHGTVVPFVERECSIQRRHQKVVEETPSPAVGPDLRRRLMDAASAVASAAGYTNAGTVEFLVTGDGAFHFLEVNARLQVEHPITEAVTGVDLVRWQIRIAGGERLDLDPRVAAAPRGHAFECRVTAEDPDAAFLPSPGRIEYFRAPAGPGVREDGGAETGTDVPVYYDSLISKLIVWGADRPEAIARMRRALEEYDIRGVRTTVPFFRWLTAQASFRSGAFHTRYLDDLLQSGSVAPFSSADPSLEEVAALVAAAQLGSPAAEDGPRNADLVPARHPAPVHGWTRVARDEGLRA